MVFSKVSMSMIELKLNVHGITVKVLTDEIKFAQLIEQYYSTFLNENVGLNVNITVEFSHKIPLTDREITKNAKRYGEGVYLNTNTLFWKNEFGFRCSLKIIEKNQWMIQGYHFDILKTLDETEILKNMIRSMRWLIHFPIFEMLNRSLNINLMHASAVSSISNTFVFAGLNKVGKSSLARYFYEKLNYYYLSDNFLLHDQEQIYSFPEKARLTGDAMDFYGLSEAGTTDVYGKKQILVPTDRVLKNIELQKIYFVNNGETLSVRKLDVHEYNNMINAAHRYLKEFSEYEYLSFLDVYSDIIGERKECIISESCLYYELTFPLNWDIESVVERVTECL